METLTDKPVKSYPAALKRHLNNAAVSAWSLAYEEDDIPRAVALTNLATLLADASRIVEGWRT